MCTTGSEMSQPEPLIYLFIVIEESLYSLCWEWISLRTC